MADFHWLRPLWFAGLLPLILIIIYLWRQHQNGNPWQQQIAPHLLPYLIINDAAPTRRRWLIGIGFVWLLMLTALAGPTWEKRALPSFKPNQALVILLDLSLSMNATDIEPTRLDRAKFKIKDILQHQNKDKEGAGLFALISYAGDAHVVTPLTDDHNTIEAMLPALNSLIMPIPGSQPDLAAKAGIELIKQAQLKQGQLLLITDDMSSANLAALQKMLKASSLSISLSILGVGSAQGAPVPLPNGSFAKTNDGQPVIARLDSDKMRAFAEQLGARYQPLTANDDDINQLLTRLPDIANSASSSTQRFDDWQDNGVWLVLLLLPIAAALFRRGWLLCVILLPLIGLPKTSYAFEWQDLWLTPAQQAQSAYQAKDYAKASERFVDPAYKGLAAYRQGDYAKASEALSQAQDVTSLYNLGNALAKAKQYEQAIQAYDQVLKQQPDHQDAAFNKTLVEKLAKQEQQQKQDQQKNGQNKKDKSKQDQTQKDQQQPSESSDQKQQEQQDQQPQPNPSQANASPQPSEPQPSEQPSQPAQSSSAPAPTASASPSSAMAKTPSTSKPSTAPSSSPEQSQRSAQESQQQEAHQALEQWLEQVPDDPSGLLRRKFLLQSQQSKQSQSENSSPATDQQGYW